MTRQRKVTVEEATLNVVGVSIKALQIGKKQMTLSVFRQLPHEAVWNTFTRKPRGVIWGRVNYFWNGCGSWDQFGLPIIDPIHIDWQSGVELHRSYLSRDLGESTDLDYARATYDEPDKSLVRAWELYYNKHIACADQLFIAV